MLTYAYLRSIYLPTLTDLPTLTYAYLCQAMLGQVYLCLLYDQCFPQRAQRADQTLNRKRADLMLCEVTPTRLSR